MSTPDQTPSLFPLVVGALTLVAWDGFSYVDEAGRTYWSGASEPSETDAADALAKPRIPTPQLSDEQIYAEHLAAGYDDPVTGLKLKTVERAQAKFGRMCTLIDLGVSQGVMTSESMVTLFDFNEAPHELTVTAFRALMLRYGLHCKTVFDLYAP